MNVWLQLGLSNALSATLLAVVVWLVTRYWRRPQVSLVLWTLVLVKLLTPPLAPLSVILPASAPPPASPPSESEIVAAFELLAARPPQPDQQPGLTERETSLGPVTAPMPPMAERATPSAALPVAYQVSWSTWQQVLVVLWLSGTVIWSGLVVTRCVRFRRWLARTDAAPEDLQREVADLAEQFQLARVPQVRVTTRALPPLVWALAGRPTLLLPEGLISRLSAAERSALLAHELAHLARRDHWITGFKLVVLAVYWWHPVAWWAARQVDRATELCCDAHVVASRPQAARSYAQALLATIDYLSESCGVQPLGSQAFSRVPLMQRRLEMILMFPPAARLAWPARIALILVACSVLPWAPRVVSAEPAAPAKASASALEQRLDRLEKLVETLAQEVRALRDSEAQTAPAVVVKSEPATDAKDVDPGITEIRVTFSKDMRDGSWSWTQRSDETYPQVTGKPHYVDKRTCVLPVKLEPGKTYFIGINSPRFGNFKDASGRSAVPFALSFSTKP